MSVTSWRHGERVVTIFIGRGASLRHFTILRDFIPCRAQMPHQADDPTRNLLPVVSA